MPNNYAANKSDPLALQSVSALENADAQTYGAPEGIPDSGRIIARPTPIASIRPDLSQPRRVMPSAVRGEWDGSPEDVPTVLANWHILVEQKLNAALDLPRLLTGMDEIPDAKHDDPLVDSYFDLLRLAASIERDGLINPIRVARGFIESGERRWLAYWLLSTYLQPQDEKQRFYAIPAIEKQVLDVWAQAAENGARSPLNAIGMARQLALLIMDMYRKDNGVRFDAYDVMVLPGECDRKFYAQVRDGDMYRIKKGMLERVLAVTGLKSAAQVSQYRAILNSPDGVWMQADEQNWTEFEIREYVRTLPSEPSDTLTHVNVSASVGDVVKCRNGHVGKLTEIYGSMGWVDGFGGHQIAALIVVEKAEEPGDPLPQVDEDNEIEAADNDETPLSEAAPAAPAQEHTAHCDCGWQFSSFDALEVNRAFQAHLKWCTGKVSEPPVPPPASPPPAPTPTYGSSTESPDPLLDGWRNKKVPTILNFLKRLTTDPEMTRLLLELLKASRVDMSAVALNEPDHWVARRREAAKQMQTLIAEQITNPIHEYLLYMDEVAREYNRDIEPMRVNFNLTVEDVETE